MICLVYMSLFLGLLNDYSQKICKWKHKYKYLHSFLFICLFFKNGDSSAIPKCSNRVFTTLSLNIRNVALTIHIIFMCLLNTRIHIVSELMVYTHVKNKYTNQSTIVCTSFNLLIVRNQKSCCLKIIKFSLFFFF